MWTVITRHHSHILGRWQHDGAVWETKEQAIEDARAAWAGTTVQWRLMSIPVDDEAAC